jgi:hypothetical protein
MYLSSPGMIVPNILLTWATVALLNLIGLDAFHVDRALLTAFIISSLFLVFKFQKKIARAYEGELGVVRKGGWICKNIFIL